MISSRWGLFLGIFYYCRLGLMATTFIIFKSIVLKTKIFEFIFTYKFINPHFNKFYDVYSTQKHSIISHKNINETPIKFK